jgi:NOL1/NOP2/fmu family ribosome biogenesis protein
MTDGYNEQPGFIPTVSIPWDSSWPELAEEADRRYLFSYMEQRFGIPETTFDDYLLFKKQKSWWLLKKSPHLLRCCRIKVSRVGLRAFQKIGQFVKPATWMIQVFGGKATKSRFDLNEDKLQGLLAGEAIPAHKGLENGYVILCLKGHVLGLGLCIDGKIRSQIPRNQLRRPTHPAGD